MPTAPSGPSKGAIPAEIVFSGYTVLCSAPNGHITERGHGLFDFDTRILSRWELTLDEQTPELVTQQLVESNAWFAVLSVPRPGGDERGPLLPQDAIEITVRRTVGPSMREEITVTNQSAEPQALKLALTLDGDFLDLGEGRDDEVQRYLKVTRTWSARPKRLRLRCSGEREGNSFERGLDVLVKADGKVSASDDGLEFDVRLGERGSAWSAVLDYASIVDGRPRKVAGQPDSVDRQRALWRDRRPHLESPSTLAPVFERAADDLFALRNQELELKFTGRSDGSAWVLSAGVPRFTGLFGRDVLTAGWQASLLGPRATLGALGAISQTQATSDDAWRDSEPGKMIHEMRRGPLAGLGITPRDAYYGSQTTPQMFVLALSELWHWTGDADVLRQYRDSALRGLEWGERHADMDGDGFLEYERRSPEGLINQGWKDSDEAIRHADGRIAETPIATVEEQAFYYIALQRMAEILLELGEDDRAESFLERARELRGKWHEAFWMPEEHFYALALDGQKKQVTSITSNPGHALATGIVPPEHARDVADRLLSDDLFSGWGVRTLTDRHPSYNPFAYHLGTVWPVEQATFALGLKRYGLDDHALRLATAFLEAAALMDGHRLPEAITGHSRSTFGRPVSYPQACNPQAWSASATVQMIQIMLGLYPFAPLGLLAVVRPRLPEFVPEVTLRNVRVGKAVVDLHFKRNDDGTATHSVVRRRGALMVVSAGPPESVDGQTSMREALLNAGLERMPGNRFRQARIAFGLE